MARLLILSSDTGEGHNSAARAIEEASGSTDWNVSVRKPLEESTVLNRSLASLYNLLLTHRPGWVNLFARTIDVLKPNERDVCYRLVRDYVRTFVLSERPDAVLSVHPMLNHMIQRWISEQPMRIPCYTFVTDPFPPFWGGWSSQYVDRYFVVTAEAGRALVERGVLSSKIQRVSMPVGAGFRRLLLTEIRELRQRLHLDGTVVLVNGGARGGGPLDRLARVVRETVPTATVLVMCGHNERARRRLDRMGDARIRTFGFLEETYSLIGAADLVITKPGALATYEALASAVPTVLSAIGGLMPQESGLFQAARRQGFAFAVRTLEELREVARCGVATWRLKRDAIPLLYDPASSPSILEEIGPANVRH